jgi:DNA-binding CsgD family transcriptional regulator
MDTEALTPRERDVFELWQRHPDWSNGQLGRTVYLPPHVVRRYKGNIRAKLGLGEDWTPVVPEEGS